MPELGEPEHSGHELGGPGPGPGPGSGERLRLSAAQTGVWLAHQRDPSGRRYAVGEYLEIHGPVDRRLMTEAWRRLRGEADVLRVRSIEERDGLWQVLAPADDADGPELPYADVAGEAEPDAAALALMRADMDRPFDLATGPLSSFMLLKRADDRYTFYHRYHHAVADGFGYSLVPRRLAAIYTALERGEEPGPSGFGSLAGLVAEDAAYRASDDFVRDRAYWTERFADMPAPTRLIRGSARPGERDTRQRLRRTGALSPGMTAALRAVARDARTGWPVVFVAAVAAYLARMTGRREVVLGLPVTGRTSPSARRTPGMLANTVPLRIEVPPQASLADLLPVVGAEFGAALAHQRYRHEDLCRDLGLTGDDRGFLGAMVNILTFPRGTAFGGAPATAHNLSSGPAVDLTFGVYDGAEDGGAAIAFDANPDFYDEDDVADHRDRFPRFLAAAVADPARPVGEIDLLTPSERDTLLHRWNDSARSRDRDGTLHGRFAAQAAATPGAVALESDGAALTFGELDARSSDLASRLRAIGVGPERFAALVIPRSPEFVVAMLAVLKAGGGYLPVDPEYPAERIRHMLEDSAPICVITGAGAGAPDVPGPARVDLDADARVRSLTPGQLPTTSAQPPDDPAPAEATSTEADDAHPAYVIYTSGSTGLPKGVVATHAGVVNLAADHIERFLIAPGTRMFQLNSPSFDASVADIWPALLSGATLVLAPAGRPPLGEELVRRLAEDRITHAALPPVVLAGLPEPDLPGLVTLATGGEVSEPEVVARWAAGRRMINVYGPTEATVAATASDPIRGRERPPIGRPVSNTRVYVLDPGLRLLPPGVPGELFVAGDGLARGYLRRPALTADRFVPCPYEPPGGRMYRTGDLVRWRPDGCLEYLGRTDDQVKVRGFRIEPREIETVLIGHPAVRAAAVVAREDRPGDRRLAAYAVLEPGRDARPADLREFAAGALPDFMVPAAVVVLDELPVTPNGKVDHRALPKPDFAAPVTGRPPRTAAERTLCALVAEVLGLEAVGADDSFFDLGGDSVMALQLVSRAHEAGLRISSREVFEHRTAAGLAAAVRDADAGTAEPPGERLGTVQATPIVRWLLETADEIDGFHQSVLLRAPAGLGGGRLAAALKALLDHHDALRLTLRPDGSLEIPPPSGPDAVPPLTRVDVAGLGEDETAAVVAAEAAAARSRLAPREGATLQAVWFDAGASTPGRLLLVVHHLAVDGVSWRILLPDLVTAFDGGVLPPVPTSFRRWANGLAATAPAHAGELDHWTRTLDRPDPPLARRPLDPAADRAGEAGRLRLRLPADVSAPLLTRVPAAYRAGAADVLLTGLALAVAEWRGRTGRTTVPDVLLDVEGHGREESVVPGADLSRTVGWFTSAHPVRLEPGLASWDEVVAGGPAAGTVLKRVKESMRAVPAHGLGHGLLRYLDPESGPELAKFAAPQIAFNYLGRFDLDGNGDWSPIEVEGGADPRMPLTHVLGFDVIARDQAGDGGPELEATVTWAPGLLDRDDVAALADLWTAALHGLAKHTGAGRTPSDVPATGLDQARIEELEAAHPGLADLLPLAPMQEALLSHAFLTEHEVDVYSAQLRFDLEGPLDPAALRTAAAAVLARHANLRAAFRYDGLTRPVQVLCAEMAPPWTEVDLTALGESAASAEATCLAERERAQRFDMARPPLLRFLLLRLAPERYRLVLTIHHILWDGWSTPVLLEELFTLYERGGDTSGLPRVTRYGDYLGWLDGQDADAAATAWTDALNGLTEPTLVAPAVEDLPSAPQDQIRSGLDEEATAALTAWARRNGLTLNTVVQGAWGLLLSHATGRDDVVFGGSVSGRPPELPGVERMVGLFTNLVPVRLAPRDGETVLAFLTRTQDEQAALIPHHHLGLAEIQRRAGEGARFDSTMVCVNYPLDVAALGSPLREVRLAGLEVDEGTHYPLRLIAIPGPRLELWLGYRSDAFERAEIERRAARLTRLLENLAADQDRPVREIDVLTPEERQRLLIEWGGYGQ
ncbi:non-ribosomal peptide synthetase [Actinomadura oligospora]|uniref:non-ribosomal peptide synthetase n=1 Tax=Actinomadura oligospora TaxID=111804 RepID=UPI0004BC5DA8|nr:non-ribosomal peptide synthetase [Actinomadura oligospora]